MTDAKISFTLPIEDIGTFGKDGKTPTYEETNNLLRALNENARSIRSDYGNGAMGHLHHTTSDRKYQQQSGGIAYVAQPREARPEPLGQGTTGAQQAFHTDNWRNYKENKHIYDTNIEAEKVLKTQFLKAVNHSYINHLGNQDDNFENVPLLLLVETIKEKFGTITPHALTQNMLEAQKPINLNEPIQEYINKMNKCRRLATAGEDPISDTMAIRLATDALTATGRFKTDLHNRATSFDRNAPRETWNQFVNWLERVDQARLEESTAEAGFHGQANATTEATMQAAITQAIALALAQAGIPARTTTSTDTRTPKYKHYCWSHGNCGHTSLACTRRKAGHQDQATKNNKMGGEPGNYVYPNQR